MRYFLYTWVCGCTFLPAFMHNPPKKGSVIWESCMLASDRETCTTVSYEGTTVQRWCEFCGAWERPKTGTTFLCHPTTPQFITKWKSHSTEMPDPSTGVVSVKSIEENSLARSHFPTLSVLDASLDLGPWPQSKNSYLWHPCFTLCPGHKKKDEHLNLVLEANPGLTSYLLSGSGNSS